LTDFVENAFSKEFWKPGYKPFFPELLDTIFSFENISKEDILIPSIIGEGRTSKIDKNGFGGSLFFSRVAKKMKGNSMNKQARSCFFNFFDSSIIGFGNGVGEDLISFFSRKEIIPPIL